MDQTDIDSYRLIMIDLTLGSHTFFIFRSVSGTEKAAEKPAEKPAMSEALMVIDSDSDNEKSKALRSAAALGSNGFSLWKDKI